MVFTISMSECYSGPILVVMLQEQQDCYNLLLATLDIILDKLRHGETSHWKIAFILLPYAFCIDGFYLWQAKIGFLVISPVFENRPFFRVPKNQWFIYLFFSCIAKCHLGKVKIKPMLVAGLSHWGQWITPETLVTWCKVFAGVALCLIVSESLQIQADNHRSNSRCFEQIFADCSWSLWINLHPF